MVRLPFALLIWISQDISPKLKTYSRTTCNHNHQTRTQVTHNQENFTQAWHSNLDQIDTIGQTRA